MHLSGIKVVFPTTPADAKGLLLASVRDPNPVVFLLDLMLAGQKGPVPEEPQAIPLGVADVKRAGEDVTILAIASALGQALEVAEELESDGISVEVVDPRTLVPFDWDVLLGSVRRTGRLVVADPARRTCGAAGEIVCRVAESAWEALESPPRRVTWEDVPIPFSPPLEEAVVVRKDAIREAVLDTVGRSSADSSSADA